MALKNSDIKAVIENLATKHKLINHSENEPHFFCAELNEFASALKNLTGYNVVVETSPYGFEGADNDNCFKNREFTFNIVKSIENSITKAEINTAFDECEEICDDFLAKFNEYMEKVNKPIITFELSSIECQPVSDGKNFGIRCSLNIKNKHGWAINGGRWND